MRWWLMMVMGLWSSASSACSLMSQPEFHVPRDAVAGEPPVAPSIPEISIKRGHWASSRGYSTSCDDIGWLAFTFADAPPDGQIGYLVTLVSGAPPTRVDTGPLATLDGGLSWSWLDGGDDDQEPFSFVVDIRTVSSTGAQSEPVRVTVSHMGTGSLTKPVGAPYPLPQTMFGDCGIAEVVPTLPLETIQVVCLEEYASVARADLRRKASLALIENAAYLDNTPEWERLVRRHLDHVGSDDIEVATRFVARLAAGNQQDARRAIELADRLLQDKAGWDPEAFVSRVYALMRTRSEASTALWVHAQMVVDAEGTKASRVRVDAARHQAQEHARQWYRFAFVSDQDAEVPLRMCADAGGSEAFCTGFVGH